MGLPSGGTRERFKGTNCGNFRNIFCLLRNGFGKKEHNSEKNWRVSIQYAHGEKLFLVLIEREVKHFKHSETRKGIMGGIWELRPTEAEPGER